MDASTRVALAGVLVSLVIGLATWLLQRRAAAASHDLGLIDQLQEERTQYRERAREADSDLEGCRDRLDDAHVKLDLQLESIRKKDDVIRDRDDALREKDREIVKLHARIAELQARQDGS